MHLKLRHLEVFNALMEAGSISNAAQRLNVTQPAVSVALSNLEKELGFRLFHRSKGYFAPTAEAQLLHADAEQGLLALSRIERRAQELRGGVVGGVTIGSNGAAAINLLPWLIAAFQRDNPSVSVDLKVRTSRQVANWVSSRQAEIGLIDAPTPVAGLETEIFRLPCVCNLLADDPLAAAPVIRPEMLAGRSIIAIMGDHPIDRRLDGLLAETDTVAKRRVTSAYFAVARNMVRAGCGVALVDSINGKADLSDGVVWRPFEPQIDFELALITARDVEMPSAAAMMHELLRERLREYAATDGGEP